MATWTIGILLLPTWAAAGEAVVRFAEPAATSLAPSDLSRGQSGRVAFVPPVAELS
ncbi:MAG: hypothetical protein R3C99_01315 [Pirellulaceae bacterium]